MGNIEEILSYSKYLVLGLNLLLLLLVLVAGLIGFLRGRRRALYWCLVTLIIIVGSWIVFPAIFKALTEIDVTKFGLDVMIPISENSEVQLTSISETLKVIVEKLIEVEEGQDVTQTQTYALMYGLLEMASRVVFIIVVLVLNWTLFKLIFFIVYLIIRPKKRDDFGVQKKLSIGNRFVGLGIGILNMIFIIFVACVPYAGFFSIAESATEFTQYVQTEDSESELATMSYRGEVFRTESESSEIINYFLDNMDGYASIYRSTAAGFLFSIKINGTEIDNRAFDGLVSINANGKHVSFRRELKAVASSASVILGKVAKPLVENDFEFTTDILAAIDGETITNAFQELSQLEIIDVVIPVGLELLPGLNVIPEDNEYLAAISIKELSKNLQQVSYSNVLAQIGDFSGALFNCFFDEEFTIKDILDDENKINSDLIIDRIFSIEDEKIDRLFNSLASIEILDAINDSVMIGADKLAKDAIKEKQILLLKPTITISEDGYVVIDGVKSNYVAPDDIEIDSYTFSLSEDGYWVVNDDKTDVYGKDNLYSLSFEGVVISDEIRNIAPIIKSLMSMNLKSIKDIPEQIQNKHIDIDTSHFTYDNISALFDSIFALKLISNNIDNVDVIVKNVIPNDFRNLVNLKGIEANDLTSLVMAAKVVYDSGVVNDLLNYSEDTLQNLDYEAIVRENGDKLIDELLSSKLLAGNITPVANALITMFVGKDTFVIPDLDWLTEGKEELKAVLDVVATVLKYKDKFGDLKQLDVSEIEDILDSIKNNLSGSKIIKSNMNNLINFLNEQSFLKDAGIQLVTLDNEEDWTEEEIANLIDGIKIIIITVKDDESETGINIYKIFNLTDEEIDDICKSEFTRKSVVNILYSFIEKEENNLKDTIVLNISSDDPKWDTELGYFLKALVRLFKGIDIENVGDKLTNQIVINLASLSNDISDPNDDVSKILNSTVLVDTFAKVITNLSDQSNGLIIVKEPINWNDYTESGVKKSGEIRTLVKAINILSRPKGAEYLIDTLTSDESKDIINVFFDTTDSDVEEILNSKIFTDTLKEFIIKYSKEDTEEDRKAYIYLKDENMSDAKWRQEIIDIIKAARILLVEEKEDPENPGQTIKELNLDKFTSGDTTATLNMLADVKDEDIDTIVKSEILVDSIAKIVNDLVKDEDTIKISDNYDSSKQTWDETFTETWRQEIKRLIKGTKAIVFDKDGNSLASNITSGDTNDLLNLLLNLKDNDEKIDAVIASDIFFETIKYQIDKLSKDSEDGTEAIIAMPDGADATENWSRADWKKELKATIYAIDKILVEEVVNPETGLTERKANINRLDSSDADSLLQIIVDLTDEDLSRSLESKIITATIAKQIKKLGDDKESDRIINVESTTNFTNSDWADEIKKIIKSLKLLVVEDGKVDTEKLKNSETDEILQMIADLKDGVDPITGIYNEENDEIKVVLESVIIIDTISEKIIDMSEEENAVVTVKDDIRGTDNVPGYTQDDWRDEIRSIIKSVNILLVDDETGKVSTEKLNSGKTDDLLQLICDLTDDEVDDVLSSKIILDTISTKIIDLGKDKEEEKAVITIKEDVEAKKDERPYWQAEIKKIIKSAKLLLTDSETGKVSTEKLNSGKTDDILQLICDLSDEDIDKVVESDIITDTISNKIIELGEDKEEQKAVITIKDDVKDGTRTYWQAEIKKIINSAKLLLVDDETGKVSTEKLNSGKTDDILQLVCDLDDSEISEVVASDVIIDTISKKIIELGEDKEEEKAVLTIKADVKAKEDNRDYWRSEVEKIINSAKLLLVDDETGKVSTEKLNSGKTDDILQLVCDLKDSEISQVVASEVIIDTISKKIIDLGEDKEEEKAVLTIKADVKAKEDDRDYWRSEVEKIIKSAKLLLVDDETGKVSTEKLNSGKTDDVLQLVCDLKDSEISQVVASEVIIDTISKKIIDLGEDKEEEKAVLTIKADVKAKEDNRDYWRSEVEKIIKSAKLLLVDDETGKVSTEKLNSGKTDDVLQLVCDLTDDEVTEVLQSEVILDTISTKIIELGDDKEEEKAVLSIKDDVRNGDRDYWQVEIKRIIKSAKLMLTDDSGKVSTEKLNSGKTDDVLQLVCDLTDDEVTEVLQSDVIIDTISKKIIDLSEDKEEEKAVLYIKDDIKVDKADDRSYWQVEVKRIIKSTKLMLTDDEGNVDSSKLNGSTDDVLQLVCDLTDEEVSEVVKSDVIIDTISKKIIDLGVDKEEEKAVLKIKDDVKDGDRDYWRSETKKIIKSTKLMLTDDEGKVDSSKLNGKTDEVLQLVCDLTDEEVTEVVKSDVIIDTISDKIVDLSNDKEEEKAVLFIKDDIKVDKIDDRAYWRSEVTRIIKSTKLMLTDDEGKVDSSKLNGTTDEVLQLVCDLTDEEVNEVVKSDVIVDTISKKIIDLGKDKEAEKAVLSIKEDVEAGDREYWREETKKIIKSTKLMLVNDEGKVDTSVLNSGDTNKILKLISDLDDGINKDTGIYNANNDEIQIVVQSDVICDTIAKKIIELGTDEEGNVDPSKTVNVTNVMAYTRDEWRGEGQEGGEIKKVIKATNILLVEEDEHGNKTVDIKKITEATDNELVELICNVTDDEADQIVKSTLITDTISKQIKTFDDKLTISDEVKAYDTDSWRVEIVALIKSSRLVVAEKNEVTGKYTVDMNKVNGDSNFVVNNIVNLKNEANDPDDEFGVAIDSVIIRDTIIAKIKDQGKAKGGILVIDENIVWTDTYENDVITETGELRKIFKALKLIFEEDDPLNPGQKKVNIDLAKLSANDVLNRTKELDSKPGEEGDQVGELLASKVISDTIIDSTIAESQKENAVIVVNYTKDSPEWHDTYNLSGEFEEAGELRRLLVAIKYLFKDEESIDMNKFNTNSILELNSSEQAKVLESNVLVDTIRNELIKLSNQENSKLVIIESNIGYTRDDWRVEIQNLIKEAKVILKPDPVTGKYLDNPTVDYDKIYSLSEPQIDELLSSVIIHNTITIALVDQESLNTTNIVTMIATEYNSTGPEVLFENITNKRLRDEIISKHEVWYDTAYINGETHRVLTAARDLMKNGEFDVDNMINLDDAGLNEVFDSVIILDTFYTEIDKLTTKENAVLYIKEGTVKDKTEAIAFVKSIKIVLGEKTIKTIDASQFNLDEFIDGKTDSELETLFASNIIKYSASIKVLDVMNGEGELAHYVELDVDYNNNPITGTASAIKEARVAMIEEDIINLVKVIRDLKANCNIDYKNGFTFASFEASAKPSPSNPDSTENADRIADTVAQSKLLVHSLPKMIHEMLSGSLNATQLAAIDTNMVTAERNFWLNKDINENGEIDNIAIDPENDVFDETGELRKIIRILTNIDDFAKDTGDVFSSKTDKDQITKPLLLINNSLVLRGLIPQFSETALSNISDWLYSPRSVLTKVEWDEEIDNLGDIIIQINSGGLGNMNSLDVKTTNTNELGLLLKLVSKSRIIDISNIESKVKTGIDSTFSTDVTVNHVYTGSVYSEKVAAWDVEIDKLITALELLQDVNDPDITDSTNGIDNAHKVGRFLDACVATTMLSDVVEEVATQVLGSYAYLVDFGSIESYETSLVEAATLIKMLS